MRRCWATMVHRHAVGHPVWDWPRGSVHGARVFDPGAAMTRDDVVTWRGRVMILDKPNIEGHIIPGDKVTWKNLDLTMYRLGTPVGRVHHLELHSGYLWGKGEIAEEKLAKYLRRGKTIGVDPIVTQRDRWEYGNRRGEKLGHDLMLTGLDVVQNPLWSGCIISAA
jgi:hypothetical protein